MTAPALELPVPLQELRVPEPQRCGHPGQLLPFLGYPRITKNPKFCVVRIV